VARETNHDQGLPTPAIHGEPCASALCSLGDSLCRRRAHAICALVLAADGASKDLLSWSRRPSSGRSRRELTPGPRQIKKMNTESTSEGKRSIPFPRDDLKIAIPSGHFRTFPGCPGRPFGGRLHGMPGEAAFPGLSPSSAALACSLLMAVGGR
jgi:hypothetical protein